MVIPVVTRHPQGDLHTKLSQLPINPNGLESNGAADVGSIAPRLTKTATRERKIAMASDDNTPSGVNGQSWKSIGELAKRLVERQLGK